MRTPGASDTRERVTRVNSQAIDPKLIEALDRATSLELFQLSTVIERMLSDPRRIIAVRLNMHLGQTVRFLDWRDGVMRDGKVIAMKDTQVTLHEQGSRREWKLPYAAIEPPEACNRVETAASPEASRPQPKPGRNDFRCGDKVSFEDRYMHPMVGEVIRINQRTASVDTGDGRQWRVPFALLRHVLDI